jgi:hypothetical protein
MNRVSNPIQSLNGSVSSGRLILAVVPNAQTGLN